MTYDEFKSWCAYRDKRGPLNPMLRQDGNFAVIATLINRALGGKANPADFMPWAKDEPEEASLDDVMNILVGGKGG